MSDDVGLDAEPSSRAPAPNERRLLAFLIDCPVVWVLGAPLVAAWAVLDYNGYEYVMAVPGRDRSLGVVVYGLYVVPLWGLFGISLGKWLMGLRLTARNRFPKPGPRTALVAAAFPSGPTRGA